MERRYGLPVAAAMVSIALVGCGSNPAPQLPSQPPTETLPSSSTPLTQPASDPVAELIAKSQGHFSLGEEQFRLGHLEQARVQFDLALEVLLTSPFGARSELRLREHFDRLVDRISAYETMALAQGDGFAEKRYEPASIDQLLAISTFDETDATPETEETVEADLATTLHDVPIPQNARVLRYVELFQTRLRDFLTEGLQRGGRYLPMIQGVFRAEGLPLDLAYIPLIESAFKPNALSRAKAKGIWQFMRGTAAENGLEQDWYIDERSDPEKATLAAAKYLRKLYEIFDGDWHLALASYNGGPGRVQRALKRARAGDFWALSQSSKYLPRETREYVPMILAAIIIARNPAQYGFDLQPEPPLQYAKVPVPRPIDLRRVAEWSGTSIDQIQALNPELRRLTTPATQTGYEVKVPAEAAEAFRLRLASAPPSEFSALRWYTVRRGDSLWAISRKLNLSIAELAAANDISTKARLRVGQDLLVPRPMAPVLSARVDRRAPADDVVAASSGFESDTVVSAAGKGAATRVVYRVKAGDTLFGIARQFNTTVASLKSWNKLRGSRINIGDRLTIFAQRSAN